MVHKFNRADIMKYFIENFDTPKYLDLINKSYDPDAAETIRHARLGNYGFSFIITPTMKFVTDLKDLNGKNEEEIEKIFEENAKELEQKIAAHKEHHKDIVNSINSFSTGQQI